jgi:23S rRNA (uracil1939-C5)-methyltransferase
MKNCIHFRKCSGCDFLDISYFKEIELKKKYVEKRIGLKVNLIYSSEEEYFYRNKLQLPFGVKIKNGKKQITLGLHSRDLKEVIHLQECFIQDRDLTEISFIIRDWCIQNNITVFHPKLGKGILKYLLLRKSKFTSEVLICFVCTELPNWNQKMISELLEKLKEFNTKGIYINLNSKITKMVLGDKFKLIYGEPYLEEMIMDNQFLIGINTFLQVNSSQSERMYEYVYNLISPVKTIYDIYSGIGTLSLYLSKKARTLVGIEYNPESVRLADLAKKKNSIQNVKFIAGDAGKILSKLKDSIDTMVLDPPRVGLLGNMITTLLQKKPKKIIYISCDVDTLSRDLNKLQNQYKVKSVAVFDMFPKTIHVETVVELERLG